MKKLIAGNWKMNTLKSDAVALAQGLAEGVATPNDRFDMVVCPPALWLSDVLNQISGSAVHLGGQDCHYEDKGAYTGNVSAPMLKDIGCDYVILGHSDRRMHHNETNELVSQKVEKAHENGLIVMLCVGETQVERDMGIQEEVVAKQLNESIPNSATAENTIIAYEAVWAISTADSATGPSKDKSATIEDVAVMHQFIRQQLSKKVDRSDKMRILYGGSANPKNAAELLSIPNVDGVLVGGASLKVDDFLAVANAAA